MTQVIPYVQSQNAPFTFTAAIDGEQYNFTVTWNLYGQRYYLNCYDSTQTLIFSTGLVGSGSGTAIIAISYNAAALTATVTTGAPHNLKIGVVVNLTLSGDVPAGYDGVFPCLPVNATQFTFPISVYPGNITTLGTVFYNIDLASGYLDTSVVWRDQSGQFEIG